MAAFLTERDLPTSFSTSRTHVDVPPGLNTTAEPITHPIAGFRTREGSADGNILIDPDGISDNVQREDPDLYNDPSSEEMDSHGEEVMEKLNKAYTAFPWANGLFIVFSNKEGVDAEVIDKVHNTSDKLCQAFQNLGFAHCQFKDCKKAEIMAAYKELAEMDLKGYKSVIIYHVCHGKNSYINVHDGFLSIQVLKAMLSEENSRLLKGKAKVVVFDCCRRGALLQSQTYDDILVVYTTSLGERSFIFTDNGMTLASKALIKLLEREEHYSLSDLFVVDLKKAVSEASVLKDGTDLKLRVNCEGGLCDTIFLYEDKLIKMAPTHVTLEEDDATGMCTVRWRKPSHAGHQNLLSYSLVCRQDNSYKTIISDISSSDTQFQVQGQTVSGKDLSVAAVYLGKEVPATKFDPSCWCPVRETSQQCNWKVCSLVLYIVLSLIILITSASLSIKYTYGFNQHSSNILGISSDVIDCKILNGFQHYLYGTTSITEVSDSNKMDSPYLGIEVFSVPYSDITYHSFYPSPKSDNITFDPGSKKNKYALPSDGYNRPWYLRRGSNITVNMEFEGKVENLPQKMTLYLFDNEDSVNDYFSNSDINPQYRSKNEVTLNKREYVFIINNSAYYYMALDVQSRYRVQLTYTVTYTVFYIDVDDYPYIQKKKIGSNGSTVHESIDLHGSNLTLCSISPIPPNGLESSSIHLQIKYAPRVVTIVIMALILLCKLAIMVTFTYLVWKLTTFCLKKLRHCDRPFRLERDQDQEAMLLINTTD